MDIRVGPDPERRAAEWIAGRLRDAHRRRGEAFLALSGGSTAPPMLGALLDQDVQWETTIVWQVDERIAPDGHAARNANQLAVIPCPVRLMPVTSPDLRRSARQYSAGLPDRFDVAHLGVGDDGHTASWPPGDTGTAESARSVELVDEFNGYGRMTLTPFVVNAAHSRAVLTLGSTKRPMVERWFLGDRSLPVTLLRSPNTFVFLDDDAAPEGLPVAH